MWLEGGCFPPEFAYFKRKVCRSPAVVAPKASTEGAMGSQGIQGDNCLNDSIEIELVRELKFNHHNICTLTYNWLCLSL